MQRSVKGSCGLSMAKSKCVVMIGRNNEHDGLVYGSLEVLVVPEQGPNIISFGSQHEKGEL